MTFIDDMLSPKQNKEANLISQGTDAQDHLERKLAASNWIESVQALDVDAVEAEYQANLAAEAKLLGKTAAQEFTTPEQVIESDYERQIKAYSDSNLMELLALARAHKDNVTAEQFAEYKEKAKANVESGRAKCEEELLKLTGEHTLLDWKAAFKKFSEEAKVEQPKEKEIYAPEVPEKHHDFDAPAESKFKMPTKEEMVPVGNGREEDERKEVTKEAVSVVKEASQKVADKVTDSPADKKEPIAMPEGKKSAGDKPVESVEESTLLSSPKEIGDKDDQAMEGNSPEKGDKAKDIESVNKEAHCGSCPGDPGVKEAADKLPPHSKECNDINDRSVREFCNCGGPLKPEEIPVKADGPSATDNCPVCGSEGQDLMNGQKENMSCEACGVTYACGSLAPKADLETDGIASDEEIAESFINGNISWVKEQIGGDLAKAMAVLEALEQFNPESASSFKRIMKGASQEIKSHASKEDVLKIIKKAEVESPWKVIKDEKGNEVIARVGIADKNIKESEEGSKKELIKSADHVHAPAPKDEKLPVEKEIEDEEKPEAKPEEKPEVKPEEKPEAKPAEVAPAPVAPVTPAVAVPAAPSASASTGGDTTSPTRTNTETGGSSPGGASTGGVGSGIGGAGTGGAATGGASTGGAGTVTVNVSGGSGTNEDGGKSAPVTINISNVGGNTDAGNVASGDGPGAAGAGGKGDGSGGGGGGAAPDEPRNFSTSSKDEKKDESDPSMFSKDISEAGDTEPEAKPEEKESTLDPINSGSDWIRDLLK